MMNKTLQIIKENDQDFEWYPTTKEIIIAVHRDLPYGRNNSMAVMDIGAGDGNFFTVLDQLESTRKEEDRRWFNKYAIEKSMILIDQMPSDIFIVGTEFHEQSLIDKKMDVIFCNPPYSEYVEWMSKIIRESNSASVYMIIPDRWKDNKRIAADLKVREADYKIVGNYSFQDSEYRTARAHVDLVRITFKQSSYYNSDLKVDPFDVWFNDHFKIQAQKVDTISEWDVTRNRSKKLHQLVGNKNIIEKLYNFYQEDFKRLLDNYKAVELLDGGLLKELGISITGLKAALKLKIEGLKNIYWKELFDNLTTITDKLTTGSREKLLETLSGNTSVDFTISNAYSVIIWAIKNANKYYDSQLISVYEKISNSDNVRLYKSNHRIIKDGWRYAQEKLTHYTLDYRIVHNHWNAIQIDTFGSYDYHNGLNKSAHETINDIITIAKNLGFNVTENSYAYEWIAGKANRFEIQDSNGEYELFAEIKAHKNGNLHYKFNQEFMKKWNIEASRLNGWIKAPIEAVQEMDNITLEEAKEYFTSNIKLLKHHVPLLESKEIDEKEEIKIIPVQMSLSL